MYLSQYVGPISCFRICQFVLKSICLPVQLLGHPSLWCCLIPLIPSLINPLESKVLWVVGVMLARADYQYGTDYHRLSVTTAALGQIKKANQLLQWSEQEWKTGSDATWFFYRGWFIIPFQKNSTEMESLEERSGCKTALIPVAEYIWTK